MGIMYGDQFGRNSFDATFFNVPAVYNPIHFRRSNASRTMYGDQFGRNAFNMNDLFGNLPKVYNKINSPMTINNLKTIEEPVLSKHLFDKNMMRQMVLKTGALGLGVGALTSAIGTSLIDD